VPHQRLIHLSVDQASSSKHNLHSCTWRCRSECFNSSGRLQVLVQLGCESSACVRDRRALAAPAAAEDKHLSP
jgi:hypothetical protein